MKLVVTILCLLLFAGSLYAWLMLEPSPFWNGFILGGLFISPLVAIFYIYMLVKESRK
jgi:hypothetical protein